MRSSDGGQYENMVRLHMVVALAICVHLLFPVQVQWVGACMHLILATHMTDTHHFGDHHACKQSRFGCELS